MVLICLFVAGKVHPEAPGSQQLDFNEEVCFWNLSWVGALHTSLVWWLKSLVRCPLCTQKFKGKFACFYSCGSRLVKGLCPWTEHMPLIWGQAQSKRLHSDVVAGVTDRTLRGCVFSVSSSDMQFISPCGTRLLGSCCFWNSELFLQLFYSKEHELLLGGKWIQ